LHARNHLAITYLSLSRVEPAVAAFEENLRKDPAHPASLLGLGRIKLYVQKDIQGGLALWEKLVEVAPDSAEAAAVRDELEALKSRRELKCCPMGLLGSHRMVLRLVWRASPRGWPAPGRVSRRRMPGV
jgi:cytochrome c-type biogenesis protein CcmH/NrfG